MGQLNYFIPFTKGSESHEDHLTRAFLVLLKLSNSCLQQFYCLVNEKLSSSLEEPKIKPLFEMEFGEINFQTQVGSLPEAVKYVSVLITNEELVISRKVEKIDRSAIYDGVISFDDEMVFFIETKLNLLNVWEKQLCPASKDIPEDAELIPFAVVLQWKQIIDILHRINKNTFTPQNEKILINDFFAFINLYFDYLNPYNDFSKCHSNYLANKRIEQILVEISVSKDKVSYHQGWGLFIELDLPEVKKIAVLLHYKKDQDWDGISIACEFGSTVSQARNFYPKIASYDVLENLPRWDAHCNFHLAFKNQNLLFFKSPADVQRKYFEYWKSDVRGNFGGVPKSDLIENFLKEFMEEGLITMDKEKEIELDEVIMKKGYQRVNICPAIYMEHYLGKEEVISMDKAGELVSYIKSKMIEVLSVLNPPLDLIIRLP
jgi:hypothetical protein